MEGLDAEPVAGKEKGALPAIPDCKGPHPVESMLALLAPMDECGQQDLGVGVAAKGEPRAFQLLPQFQEVVYLAVVRDVVAAVRRSKGLTPVVRKV